MKKIVIYVDSLSRGGAEHVSVILGEYLSDNNYDCTIITERICKDEYNLSNKVKRISLSNDFRKSKNFFKNVIKLRRLLKMINPDIMLIMDIPACLFGIPASRFLKIKVVVSERNDPYNFSGKKIVCIISRFFMRMANGFIFQTRDAQQFYCKKIKNKGVVIQNPLVVSDIPLPKANINKKIVSVGRLSVQKNQKLLIDAFYNISKKYGKEYKLEIYGDGPLRENLKKYVYKLGLSDFVLFPGNVSDVFEKINGSFMFVMSSNYEGLPNALIEAMAMGIPCISTDCSCGGPKSLISHKKNGLLCKVNDVNDLTQMMEYYIDNNEKRLQIGKAAVSIKEKLDSNKICKKWISYFINLH